MTTDARARIDPAALEEDLEAQGWSALHDLLTASECDAVAALYAEDARLSQPGRDGAARVRAGASTATSSYPLPPLVQGLRTALYPRLAPLIANRWHERMGMPDALPARRHDGVPARCAAAGQIRPTPLLLQYGAGDYNCLHQDLYGEHVFPLQVAVLLSSRARTSAAASSC